MHVHVHMYVYADVAVGWRIVTFGMGKCLCHTFLVISTTAVATIPVYMSTFAILVHAWINVLTPVSVCIISLASSPDHSQLFVVCSFLRANNEKLGVAWGRGYNFTLNVTPLHTGFWPSAATSSTGLSPPTSSVSSTTPASPCSSSSVSSVSTRSSSQGSIASASAWTRGACSSITSL